MNYTVADLVAEFLAACGVRTAFGIVSVHNIPLLDAIGRRNAIRFIPTRGEMGGGHMADAYARVSGGLGVLITSTGPAAASAMPALVEAGFAGSSLLHITSQTATPFIGRDAGTVHDVTGQTAMLTSVSKASFAIAKPEHAFGVLVAAAAAALSAPTGPVNVEIPIDLQRATIARPDALDDLILPIRDPVVPAAAALDALASMLAQSRRPMLWLGNGARQALAQALALMDMGFGAVTSWRGRGIVPEDHPLTFGAMHGNGTPDVEEFYKTVDVMVVVGSRLRGHETRDFKLRLPENLIQIDIDPRANGRTYLSKAFVVGDAALVLDGLRSRLAGKFTVDRAFAADIARTRQEAAEKYRVSLGPYADFPAQLRAAMPHDAIWVRDATVAGSTWAHRLVPLYGPRDSVHAVGSAIGLGLPFGIGAALAAAPCKTVALVGDGGFAVNMSELWTAAQEKAELCIIIMNDRLYTQIAQIQDAVAGGRRFYDELQAPDFVKLAELAGVPAWRVSDAASFGSTLAEALKVSGPSLVEVDMTAIGPAASLGTVTGLPS